MKILKDAFDAGYEWCSSLSPEIIKDFGENAAPDFEGWCEEERFAIRSAKIELLEQYSMWLTKNGYMDTDWKDEEPYAIDEFLRDL